MRTSAKAARSRHQRRVVAAIMLATALSALAPATITLADRGWTDWVAAPANDD